MKFTSIVSIASIVATTIAKDVACLVNGEQVAVVDLDTGSCPFSIPAALPVNFDFVSAEEYDVTFYYAIAQSVKYFNDIVEAGRLIEIPADALYGTPGAPLFQVHLEESPAANSTVAIRRRLLKQVEVVKRAEVDAFLATAKSTDGTEVTEALFEVVDVSPSTTSGSGAASDTATVTNSETTTVVITSCSNDVCHEGTVPATASSFVTTVDETVYTTTTYCPIATVVTITSCSDNKCHETEVPATPVLTTETIGEEVTSYYTYCPLTGQETPVTETELSTTVITVTSCSDNKCHETTVPATPVTSVSTGQSGEESTYTSFVEVTETTGTAPTTGATTAPTTGATTAPTTVAAESTTIKTSAAAPSSVAQSSTAAISTYGAAGVKVGSSVVAAMIPLLGFLL